MVHSDMSKSPPSAAAAQELQMDAPESAAPAGALGAPAQSYGKGARRKNRFKGSDGSTSSDTTSNSFVRQILEVLFVWLVGCLLFVCFFRDGAGSEHPCPTYEAGILAFL
uniref:Calcium voltage-gated channel auxiliary subunit beta 2 n=1 Tax=Pipistrellus kuhlii TaxID=59472 RepID=A0A7J8AYS2_PIPKU|nr:calcium voltage-gated channel auxiliary subunit beta 2 [Pipistrellus kuhlii]